MPFKSKAQVRKCGALGWPAWCREFAKATPSFKLLPERKGGKSKRAKKKGR